MADNEESEHVTVAPGRTVYHGGGVHGFVAGARVPLPKSHITDLTEGEHVIRDAAPPPPAAKPKKSAAAD